MIEKAIVVDDTSPLIRYSPSSAWNIDLGTQDPNGNGGPTYNHTSHATAGNNGSRIDFDFSGTSIEVSGTIDALGKPLPTWKCSIFPSTSTSNSTFSSTPIGGTTIPTYGDTEHGNQMTLCSNSQFPPGKYRLTIEPIFNASGQDIDGEETFWFDYITYTPISNSSFYNIPSASSSSTTGDVPGDGRPQVVRVGPHDSDVVHRGNWTIGEVPWSASVANAGGASVEFTFIGNKVSLYGMSLQGQANDASYSIDHQAPVSFQLPPSKNGHGGFTVNTLYFTSSELATSSNHTLSVNFTNDGTPTGVALVVASFVVEIPTPTSSVPLSTENGSPGGNTTGSNDAPNGTGNHDQPASHSNHTPNRAASIGGAVAGVIILLLIISSSLFILRKRRQRSSPPNGTMLQRPGGVTPLTLDTFETPQQSPLKSNRLVSPTNMNMGDLESGGGVYYQQFPLPGGGQHHGKITVQAADGWGTGSSSNLSPSASSGSEGPSTTMERNSATVSNSAEPRLSQDSHPPPPFHSPLASPLIPPQPSSHPSTDPFRGLDEQNAEPQFVVHQDSGIRIMGGDHEPNRNREAAQVVIDIPPNYTPS